MNRAFGATLAALMVLTGACLSVQAYDGKRVNGMAVSVRARHTEWFAGFGTCESGDRLFDGAVVLYTIRNSAVTEAKTIHSPDKGPAQFAAFNLAGTKVAFYRFDKAPGPTGSCVSATEGKGHISIINPDGTGLTDLCEINGGNSVPSGKEPIFPLDWPAGDWIYFFMPHDADFAYSGDYSSTVVWRVNAVTKVSERVCNFTNDGSGVELKCSYIRRLTMPLTGDYVCLMSYPKYGCTTEPAATEFFSHVNGLYRFPPADGNLGAANVGSRNGCNAAVSPSGNVVANYFAGWHDDLKLGTPNYAGQIPDGVTSGGVTTMNFTIGTMESWAGEEIGNGAENIRWAVNSDKWVLQGIGLTESGHADNNSKGCNQVAANWVDKVAINISKNPRPYGGAVYIEQTRPSNLDQASCWNSGPGDMWIDDPVNNPDSDKYEDLEGVWHSVDITAANAQARSGVSRGIQDRWLTLDNSGRQILLALPNSTQWGVSLVDLQGREVLRRTSTGAGLLPLGMCPSGVYVVTARNANTVHQGSIVLK